MPNKAVASPSVQEIRASYGELGLTEQPAINLLTVLGWQHHNLYAETFGLSGSERRASESQVILTRQLSVQSKGPKSQIGTKMPTCVLSPCLP